MQTFLPYADFQKIADCLDKKRLGAMLREPQQALDTIYMNPTRKGTPRKGYIYHPLLNLWRGYEDALRLYINTMRLKWIAIGNNSNFPLFILPDNIKMPPWIGNEDFHSRHRSQLYYKLPSHYAQFNWPEASLPIKDYIWNPRTYLEEVQ